MEEEDPLNDKDLEKKAVTDLNAREELRQAVRTTALYQARQIIKVRQLSATLETKLVDAGMSTFDTAFNVYLKSMQIVEEDMNFSPYFGWWARQAMARYLEQNTK
ncbi:MAG TPA: hypothetical protein VNF51_00565 [Candidatus Paceibacterota bacterium]|nr:hypothetical protein [Candidatus Paceibacterota bacterium]